MNNLKSHFDELKSRESIIALSSLILIVLYIYQGNPAFFYQILFFFNISLPHLQMDFLSRIWQCFCALFLFFFIPLIFIKNILKESPENYGLKLGDFAFVIKLLIPAIVFVLPFVYISSFQTSFQEEYPLPLLARENLKLLLVWEFAYLFFYIGWEFMFRGYLLFGLEKKMGSFWAVIFQTFPSTIIHIGKPEAETISAIIAGFAFGFLSLRTRSILYPLILHYIIGISMDIFALINSRP